ncbi:MAG: hypothetical protein SFV54_15000 [Bryobacteraceae bacterium]|nr:hypothetical protein [Bryobacteraceae bacterium]
MRERLALLLVIAGASLWAQGGYSGPSILSRGSSQAGRRGAETLRFRFFANVNGTYDSGLLAAATNEQGELEPQDSVGVQAILGAYGYKSFRRSLVGLEYRGDYRHYTNAQFFNGSNQYLALNLEAQPKRRVGFVLRPTVGMLTRPVGGFVPLSGNWSDVALPVAELFDNRTFFAQLYGAMVWQKSARLSFSAGGQAVGMWRRTRALADVRGSGAMGDVAYRLSRQSTLFGSYNFLHFAFPGGFGGSDIHQTIGGYARQIGRYWTFSVAGGAIRIEFQGLRRTAVDPVVAALTGQRTTIEAFYALNYVPYGQISLGRSFRKSTVTASYTRGVNPGNGLFLTSKTETASLQVSHTALRRWHLSASASYVSLGSVSPGFGSFETISGGGGVSYRLNSLLHFVTRVDLRRAELQATRFTVDAARVSVGVAFTPGDIPLSLW